MLAIARALAGNPAFVMLDEPSQGLAPLLVRELGSLMLRLKREGGQLLYLLGAGLEGESYEELQPKTFGPKDIQQVLVRVTTGKQPCSVDVRLIDLRIRSVINSGRAPGRRA